jgi:hypothetical protein
MNCKHYPNVGIMSEHYNDWEVVSRDMNSLVKRCKKCGQVDLVKLTSVKADMFLTDSERFRKNKLRDEHAVDMIQPIDSKTGKFNEDFGKKYGYNPLKTPAPIVNRPDDEIDRQMANDNIDESKLKIKKL